MSDLTNKPLAIIVAIAENNAIGKGNQLLCHLPADLIRFKKITSGHKVIMGRNTYFSLPIKPLPKRENIIITDTECNFVTAAHLTEVRRQYYELDLLNEFSGERYVFMIPKQIFMMTLMNRRIIKPQVVKVKDRNNNNKTPNTMSI